MYSCPAPTSIGTICPGSFVAKETPPGAPMARYSVMNSDPPPATRFSTPKIPPPPLNWVWVVIWIELVIQDSSPASEITDSLGSRVNSSTGMVVPRMRFCMVNSCSGLQFPRSQHIRFELMPRIQFSTRDEFCRRLEFSRRPNEIYGAD